MTVHAPCADGPEVRPGQAGGYFVRSRTTRGAWWFVWDLMCSCPAGQRAVDTGSLARCYHVRRVMEHAAEQNRTHKRPTAPPNVSALVD